MKTYSITNNYIIINPGTSQEKNITKEVLECEYCKCNPKTCGYNDGVGSFCDWFTILREYKVVD